QEHRRDLREQGCRLLAHQRRLQQGHRGDQGRRVVTPEPVRFEAIGTAWQIDADVPIEASTQAAIHARIEQSARAYSRFRDDSLVARIASTPGTVEFPADAAPLFGLYRRLYEATDGAMSPLVGRSL